MGAAGARRLLVLAPIQFPAAQFPLHGPQTHLDKKVPALTAHGAVGAKLCFVYRNGCWREAVQGSRAVQSHLQCFWDLEAAGTFLVSHSSVTFC